MTKALSSGLARAASPSSPIGLRIARQGVELRAGEHVQLDQPHRALAPPRGGPGELAGDGGRPLPPPRGHELHEAPGAPAGRREPVGEGGHLVAEVDRRAEARGGGGAAHAVLLGATASTGSSSVRSADAAEGKPRPETTDTSPRHAAAKAPNSAASATTTTRPLDPLVGV